MAVQYKDILLYSVRTPTGRRAFTTSMQQIGSHGQRIFFPVRSTQANSLNRKLLYGLEPGQDALNCLGYLVRDPVTGRQWARTVIGQSACCETAGCSLKDQWRCLAAGGSYHNNTPCTPNPCGSPGACCQSDKTCVHVTASECAARGGTFKGEGTQCAQQQCSLCTDCDTNWPTVTVTVSGVGNPLNMFGCGTDPPLSICGSWSNINGSFVCPRVGPCRWFYESVANCAGDPESFIQAWAEILGGTGGKFTWRAGVDFVVCAPTCRPGQAGFVATKDYPAIPCQKPGYFAPGDAIYQYSCINSGEISVT